MTIPYYQATYISVRAAPQPHSVWAWRSSTDRQAGRMTDEWTGWMEWTGAWPDYLGPLSLILVIATRWQALPRPHPRWNPVASASVPRWENEGRREWWVALLSLTGVDGCQGTAINQKRQMWRWFIRIVHWLARIYRREERRSGNSRFYAHNATGDEVRSPEHQSMRQTLIELGEFLITVR